MNMKEDILAKSANNQEVETENPVLSNHFLPRSSLVKHDAMTSVFAVLYDY